MPRHQGSAFTRCLKAMLVWLFLSSVLGMLAAYFGPGAAAFVMGLFLGLCGMVLHLFLWAIERTPQWSYSGIVFGAVTTISLVVVNGSSSWQPQVVFLLFIVLSLSSYIIYPVASCVLGESPESSSINTSCKH